jgi:hypothetical protein
MALLGKMIQVSFLPEAAPAAAARTQLQQQQHPNPEVVLQ